jgi:hypothetical protein
VHFVWGDDATRRSRRIIRQYVGLGKNTGDRKDVNFTRASIKNSGTSGELTADRTSVSFSEQKDYGPQKRTNHRIQNLAP